MKCILWENEKREMVKIDKKSLSLKTEMGKGKIDKRKGKRKIEMVRIERKIVEQEKEKKKIGNIGNIDKKIIKLEKTKRKLERLMRNYQVGEKQRENVNN